MKKHGILNSHISKILSDLGHTDTIVIADVGLPIPKDVPRIDLALKLGVPSFEDVVNIIAEDIVIEKIIVAEELEENNTETSQFINAQFKEIEIKRVSHEQFKNLTQHAKVIIRTGEAKPYANCILQSGVNFGK
ncbi:MAG: D-ribose pyranase [Candidatus Pristimantibacillus lignocellulolyticus]|uniref:D-ribose pyranase n=1 Tax=Candidatus Pristimantibacillus lignocellulolyticus TaxID=2994561 RepID=A0A9J6ZB20_9BACL|nr:MAG: D-ribose pyranase [Candidatus Pristimantibacillus lignocellulolyticus]